MTWILLAVFLAFMTLQFMAFWFFVAFVPGLLTPSQLADFEQRLAFPGVFGAVFGHVNGLGGIFAVVLAAGFVGGDYGWGTLRTYLPRQPNRTRYLLAKLAALLLALLAAMLIALACGALLAVVFGTSLGTSMPTVASIVQLPLAMLRALLVLLPYVLITIAATVYGRSLIVGLVVGILFQLVDIALGVVALVAQLGGVWQMLYQLMIQANIATLTNLNSTAFGLDPAAINQRFDPAPLPPPVQATIVIVVYCASFLATALWSFQRHDITSGA